jgi:hypothetical protein
MNAKQKIHQARLSKWAALIKEQSSSGLTIKEWCLRNNVSFHAYNYWKHQLKETVVDSVLPDIVPLPQVPVTIPAQHVKPDPLVPTSYNSRDLHDASPMVNSSVSVCLGDVRIEIGPNASDVTVLNIIKAVRHV